MSDNRIYLGRIGEWIFCKYYFDKENDEFIEEKYHYEYLDTGTVFDSSSTVSAQHIYDEFVRCKNTSGIEKLFELYDEKLIQK